MASHQLIDDYLAGLACHLPAEAVDELADGLHETWRHHLATGLRPAVAAHAAIADFGDHRQVISAFVAQAPGRRIARLLLASGPLVGVCWAVSLVSGEVWAWRVPAAAAGSYALVLVGVVAALGRAATSRHDYHRTRLGAIGGIGLVVLDTTMLAGVVLIAPAFVWPMAVAIPASLARVGLTLRRLPAALTR